MFHRVAARQLEHLHCDDGIGMATTFAWLALMLFPTLAAYMQQHIATNTGTGFSHG